MRTPTRFFLQPTHLAGRREITSVQYLRGFAALAVVYDHVFSNRITEGFGEFSSGLWGVDIFFVISGFVMWFTTANREMSPHTFIVRRLYRIYPLYWIALTIWIVSRLIFPDRFNNADVTPQTVLYSFLLIPHYHIIMNNMVFPILVPGWTLQIELFFYAIFSISLLTANLFHRVLFLTIALTCLVIVGQLYFGDDPKLITYTSPMLLEFLAGVWIAFYFDQLRKIPSAIAITLIVAALIILIAPHQGNFTTFRRFLMMGVPSIVILFSFMSLERFLSKHRIRPLILLGDASFSLYLCHSIVTGVIAVFLHKVFGEIFSIYFVVLFTVLSVIFSIVVAVFSFTFIEKPMLSIQRKIQLRAYSAA